MDRIRRLGASLRRNIDEAWSELKKVTWPTRKETQAATLVVVVTVIIAAMLLGLFDMVWSWLTDRIYG